MSEHELEERLRRWGEGGPSHRDEPVAFAGVRARVQRRRRQRLVGVAAAAAVTVAVPLGWAAIAGTGGASTAPATELDRPACPQKLPQGADAEQVARMLPSTVKAGTGRLVPEGDVVAVTVCRYDSPYRGEALAGQRALGGDLEAMVADLREVSPRLGAAPTGCLTRGSSGSHLVRVDYEGGSAWLVTKDGRCWDTARLGKIGVESFDPVNPEIMKAYDDSTWPGMTVTGCDGRLPMRRGAADELVPGDPVGAVICPWPGGGTPRAVQDLPALVTALRAAPISAVTDAGARPVAPGSAVCGFSGDEQRVILRYTAGPDLQIMVDPGCHTSLYTQGIGAQLTPELATILGIDID